jgi:adenosylhomocysteine nucleosidase
VERIAIFAALRWECRPILRHLRRVERGPRAQGTFWRGHAPGREIWLIKTAIGAQRATAAARVLDRSGRFDLFLSTGCAGALAPELLPGDLAIATAVIGNASGARYETDPAHRERARAAAQRAALRTVVGPVLCSPHVLASVAAKHAAAASSGSVAVEMEGAAIGALARQAGVPFASVRAILDAATTELPYAGEFLDPQTGALRPLDVVRYLTRQPGALSQLVALRRMMTAAQSSLEKFFEAWLAG